ASRSVPRTRAARAMRFTGVAANRWLTEHWGNGLRTLHGFYSAGFPNCFHMGITQNALTANFPHMLDEQSRHIAQLIQRAKQNEARCIEPTPEAEAEWVATIKAKALNNLNFLTECTPGYYNNEGKPSAGARLGGGNTRGGPPGGFLLRRKKGGGGGTKGGKIRKRRSSKTNPGRALQRAR